MPPKSDPALEHMRRMEERIKKQLATIADLRKRGLDTAPAMARLTAIRRAVKEMSFQLALLMSQPGDAKRPTSLKPARKK
jgi:hypothetical protein